MLERESAFYKAHQTEFHEKYHDKWLVIVGETVCGVYETAGDAAEAALQQYEPGKILIHAPANDGKILEVGPGIITLHHPGDKSKPKTKPVITYV